MLRVGTGVAAAPRPCCGYGAAERLSGAFQRGAWGRGQSASERVRCNWERARIARSNSSIRNGLASTAAPSVRASRRVLGSRGLKQDQHRCGRDSRRPIASTRPRSPRRANQRRRSLPRLLSRLCATPLEPRRIIATRAAGVGQQVGHFSPTRPNCHKPFARRQRRIDRLPSSRSSSVAVAGSDQAESAANQRGNSRRNRSAGLVPVDANRAAKRPPAPRLAVAPASQEHDQPGQRRRAAQAFDRRGGVLSWERLCQHDSVRRM